VTKKKATKEAATRKMATEEVVAKKKAIEELVAKKATEEAAAKRKAVEEVAAKKKALVEAAKKTQSGQSPASLVGVKRAVAPSGSTQVEGRYLKQDPPMIGLYNLYQQQAMGSRTSNTWGKLTGET
jgi:hypothetical protein